MFLKLESTEIPMKLVYQLRVKHEKDPAYIKIVQALTLNKLRPFMGLKGTYGLYGSEKWWHNIRAGVMPLRLTSGMITRTYWAGQDKPDGHNSFSFTSETGGVIFEGFYANNPEDLALFKVGARVEILYAIDEYKEPSFNDGSGMVLEMAVSCVLSTVDTPPITSNTTVVLSTVDTPQNLSNTTVL